MESKKNAQTEVVATCDIKIGKVEITSDRILSMRIYKGQEVTMETVHTILNFIEQQGGGKYLKLFIFEPYADVSSEVKNFAASPPGYEHTLADAIVVVGLPQRIIADFYLKFNKPEVPTKIFRTEAKAREWLLKFKVDS